MSGASEGLARRAAVPLIFLVLSVALAGSAIVARARTRVREAAAASPPREVSALGALTQEAGIELGTLASEVTTRLARDSALTVSLIIPVIAGLGLNFGIVIGAMAGQVALVAMVDRGLGGARGLALAILIAMPLAALLGLAVAALFNRAKGREMITGMIAGFFANGLYQLVFRFMAGTVIPIDDKSLLLDEGFGVTNTVALGSLTKALDAFWFRHPVVFIVLAWPLAALAVRPIVRRWTSPSHASAADPDSAGRHVSLIVAGAGLVASAAAVGLLGRVAASPESIADGTAHTLGRVLGELPLSTFAAVAYLCLAVHVVLRTKLGQEMRAIGQDMHVAEVAGIRVDRVRTIAVVLSTVGAAVGQIIFLQDMGTINTYNSHEQVGMFAVAALLIGGASIFSATLTHALVGTLLFHTLFYLSPVAGRDVLDNPQMGEYFRSFVAYGVIAVALAIHAAQMRRTRAAALEV